MRNRITVALLALLATLGATVTFAGPASAGTTYGDWKVCPVGAVGDYLVRPLWYLSSKGSQIVKIEYKLAPSPHQPLPDKVDMIFTFQTDYQPETGVYDVISPAASTAGVWIGSHGLVGGPANRHATWVVDLTAPAGTLCTVRFPSP